MTEETKPVAWIPDWELPLKTKTMVYDRNHDEGYVPLYTHTPKPESVEPVAYIPTNPADGIEWVKPSPQWGTPLYTAPPQTQAAVSAALRTAAEVLEVGEYDVVKETYCGNVYEDATATINELQKAILALPQDDSALRELCLRVAEEVNYSEGECTTAELQDIVGRVLNT